MFNRTGLNLLNKIQFTFEVVPCWILGLFRQFFEGVHQFSPSVTRDGRVGGEGGMGREEEKPPQVNTRGEQLLIDGPDYTTGPKGHHSG